MAVFVPTPVKQLDGSRFQGTNCNCASDAMLVARATHGRRTPSSARIRRLTGDTVGGTNLRQVHDVNRREFGFVSVLKQPIDWALLMERARNDRGFVLQIYYKPLASTRFDCFRGNFKDNHSIYINSMNADGTLRGADPGADGRYKGCPKGYQNYPQSLLRKAAGMLDLSGLGTSSYRPLGEGRAYALLCPVGT